MVLIICVRRLQTDDACDCRLALTVTVCDCRLVTAEVSTVRRIEPTQPTSISKQCTGLIGTRDIHNCKLAPKHNGLCMWGCGHRGRAGTSRSRNVASYGLKSWPIEAEWDATTRRASAGHTFELNGSSANDDTQLMQRCARSTIAGTLPIQ